MIEELGKEGEEKIMLLLKSWRYKVQSPDWLAEKDGEWIRWDENGTMTAKAHYNKGEKDGKWFIWDENGKMRYQMVYENGNKTDTWYMWDENENLISEKTF